MADSTAMPESRYHVRSISLPTRSHPTATCIEEELSKLRALESLSTAQSGSQLKAESICVSLLGLAELHKCIENFLQMPQTQQALLHHQHKRWVEEMIDGSVTLLDIGGAARDILIQMKEIIQDIQSALRRRKLEVLLNKVTAYISFKKRVKKDVSSCLKTLKRLEEKYVACPLLDYDHDSAMVVRVLREVSSVAISIFWALLSFLSIPVSKPKVGRWNLVSKLMQRGLVACDNEVDVSMNEVESVDVALFALSPCNASKDAAVESSQTAQKRLKDLEVSLESVEEGLDFLFRRLIQTRVSLLNILTH
ncbi:PREDICTED: uncharacterized protein LOC104611765 [Nelumbo nucifera]|uniref:Uncharacterized protein LOC104611765 n=2 Tax=Nelumbo nucifera TaxID=4432 RepID=A0A1U8BK96_NELNU|nr:PREDICTED: uncharacterized protein LOC104611765 [Nelumbo nucifera]DAD45999.1 TPA_asm: hypothetical protein HUJ06_004229 [Nelumbo nucifera]